MARPQSSIDMHRGETDLLDKPSKTAAKQEADAFAEFLSRLDRRYETLNAQLDTLLSGLRTSSNTI